MNSFFQEGVQLCQAKNFTVYFWFMDSPSGYGKADALLNVVVPFATPGRNSCSGSRQVLHRC